MKHILNFIKGTLFTLWLIIAIFTTICLLSYNDYQVSEFGKYSLLIINNKELRSVYEQDSLVIIKKANEEDYKKGDKILFYSGNPKVVNFINLGEITDVHSENGAQASYYIGDYKLSYDDIIGNVNGSIVYKKAGLILSVIESRWGFMFFVILPTIFLAVYELYAVINEVKKNSKVDLKEELRKEIEEEMRQEELKKKAEMKKNKTKKILWVTAVFFAFIALILIINESYALLQTISSGSAEVKTGSWTIKLNEKNISNGITETFTLNNMIYDESNENIENGYIAPGKSGYFDIVLDPSGTDVAISYEINVRLDECAYPNNIKLSVENTSTDGGVEVIGNTFKGLISLNDIKNNKTITLKLTLIWENNEEFNESDTKLGTIEANKLKIPITITLNQYQG